MKSRFFLVFFIFFVIMGCESNSFSDALSTYYQCGFKIKMTTMHEDSSNNSGVGFIITYNDIAHKVHLAYLFFFSDKLNTFNR